MSFTQKKQKRKKNSILFAEKYLHWMNRGTEQKKGQMSVAELKVMLYWYNRSGEFLVPQTRQDLITRFNNTNHHGDQQPPFLSIHLLLLWWLLLRLLLLLFFPLLLLLLLIHHSMMKFETLQLIGNKTCDLCNASEEFSNNDAAQQKWKTLRNKKRVFAVWTDYKYTWLGWTL